MLTLTIVTFLLIALEVLAAPITEAIADLGSEIGGCGEGRYAEPRLKALVIYTPRLKLALVTPSSAILAEV